MVDVPEMQFLAIDGQGDPNTSPYYAQAVESLFSVAYALKFQSKNQLGRDMTVGPLEGLWRGSQEDHVRRNKGNWRWTTMISQPDWIGTEALAVAQEKAWSKTQLPAIEELRLTRLLEGPCAQILHVGPYENERPVLARLHQDYKPNSGLAPTGDHHEIYLNAHLHVWPMQLIEENAQVLDSVVRQDVVNLPANGRVKVRVAFKDFTGRSVYHCHLDHEDLGMIGVIEVR